MSNVSIIGAGVVGLILAKELSARGIETTVYDGKRNVSDDSDKASGVLSKHGLDSMGIPYSEAVINKLSGAVIHSQTESIRVHSKHTQAFVVDRGKLTEICAAEAKRAGAEIKMSTRLSKSDLIKMAKECSVLVGADGAVSTTASAFGFPEIKDYVLTYKVEYDNAKIEDPNSVGVYFDNQITHKFFGWSIPHSKSLIELGIGVDSRRNRNSRIVFNEFVKRTAAANLIKEAKQKGAARASLIPLSARKRSVIGNALLVGDAAGQVKATTGGGLVFGTACAKIAAFAIQKHLEGRSPLAAYDSMWRRKYGTDLSLHGALRRYYSSLNGSSMDMTFKLLKFLGAEDFLGKYGDMDRPSLIIKRFVFRGAANNRSYDPRD